MLRRGERHRPGNKIRGIRDVLALNGKSAGIGGGNAAFQLQIPADKTAGIQDDAGGIRIDLHLSFCQRLFQCEGRLLKAGIQQKTMIISMSNLQLGMAWIFFNLFFQSAGGGKIKRRAAAACNPRRNMVRAQLGIAGSCDGKPMSADRDGIITQQVKISMVCHVDIGRTVGDGFIADRQSVFIVQGIMNGKTAVSRIAVCPVRKMAGKGYGALGAGLCFL